MIEPTAADIGRRVAYKPIYGRWEWGVITSFNDDYVFVRYGVMEPAAFSKATLRGDLEWAGE